MTLQSKRISKGYSQSKLADLSNVSIRMIQKYETGDRDINKCQADTLYKLAKALECNMEDLINIKKDTI